MVSGIEGNRKVKQSQSCDSTIHHPLKTECHCVRRAVSVDRNFLYLRCHLEAKMSGVIHKFWGLGKISLVTSGAWKSMKLLRTLSYCWAGSVASLSGYLIISESFDIGLKGCNVDRLQLLLFRVQYGYYFFGIFKWATTEKWSESISDCDTEGTSHSLEKFIRSSAWPLMWVGN